jgi:hypothetical protein
MALWEVGRGASSACRNGMETGILDFLSKGKISLQKRALRSGWKIQNLLSWAALAL